MQDSTLRCIQQTLLADRSEADGVNRLAGGTASTDGRIYSQGVPQETAFPYLFFSIAQTGQNSCFGKDGREFRVEVRAVGETGTDTSAVTQILDRVETLMERSENFQSSDPIDVIQILPQGVDYAMEDERPVGTIAFQFTVHQAILT